MSELAASVVIPTHERRPSLQALLHALTRQTVQASRFEVVVIIDGSEDGTQEAVASLRVPYTLRAVWQPCAGRGSACNAGIRLARGRIVVLLDDDMEPTTGWLAAHLKEHEFNAPAGIIGAAPPSMPAGASGAARYLARKFERLLRTLEDAGRELRLRDFYAGNFSIDRPTIEAVGLFDEEFAAYGNEDLDLFARLRAAGVPVRYSAAACALQRFDKELRTIAQDHVAKGRTAIQLARKHPSLTAELKLARRLDPPWYVRFPRDAALAASDRNPEIVRHVIAAAAAAERALGALPDAWYAHLFGFCYWVGARDASSEPNGAEAAVTTPTPI